MKNKINLIERLWDDSHEKQTMQKFGRYVVMLLMLLTLGVGQMWAATWSFSGTSYMYFHNKAGWTDSGKMLFIGKDSYSSVYSMSAVSNTQLWVVQLPSSGWSDASYMAVAGGGSVWGSGSWGASNRTNATHYTNTYTSGLSTSSTQYYVFIPSSTSNNASISLTYLGNAISNLNKTITVKAKVSTDGGSSYSEATSPGTLSASSKTFTAYNSCGNSTSLSSGTISCGYTATTTLTAADATGYDFVGWYNSSGTQQTTSKTLTIYPTANATYYAYYKEKQYSLTFSHNGHGSIAVGGNTVSSGSTANVNYFTTMTLVASPSTGYNFSGWTKSGSNTGSVTIGNAANASTTIKATNTGATITAGFTPKTTTITFNKQSGTDGSDGVTATYDAAMPDITLPEKDGYTFGGYWGAPGGSGPQYYNADGSSAQNWNNEASTYTLYAKWTENKSTVTLVASPEGKGTFQVGGVTVTSTQAGVTTTPEVTAVPIAGYSFTGWSISGGATISSTSTNPTTVTGKGAGADATLTATFEEDLTYYDVTFGVGTSYTSLGSISATNNTTSSAISSGDDILSASNITFTATPNTGYVVEGWYTDAACTAGKHDEGSTTYTIASLSSAVTVYVKFVEKTWSVAFAAGTGGTVTTPAATPQTVGQVTGISIEATPATGYTFNTWTITSGSGSFTSAATTNSNTFKPTAASTITAGFSETMSSLSTSCSYDAGTPGYAAPTVSSSATDVGYVTTRTITATAAGTGYTFAGWTLTNCTRTDGGAATATQITIRSNGDGAAASVVANYNEDLSSPYTLKGGTNVTGDSWATAHNFTKKTGHSTESVAYCTFNVSSTNSGISSSATDWSFKVLNGGTWYGLTADGDSWWYQRNSGQQTLSTSGKNIQLCADVAGPYEIKVDYTTPASPKVTVTFPTSYTLTYSIGSVAGNNGSITTSPSTASGSKVLSGTNVTLTGPAAKTGYTWKGWYTNAGGTEGNIPDVNRAITVTMNANKTLYACYTENTYNVSASASPAAGGSVTPTSATSMGQITGGDITASPNPGYSFTSWAISSGSGYFGASGTATTSTTANTKFRPTAASTLTGTFSEVMRTVSVVSNNTYLGSVSAASLTSVGPATKSAEVTATPETGATFTRWDVESGVTIASGYTSTSNPVKVNATAASKTLTAVFTETTYTVSMSTADDSKGTVGAASASVGQITAVEITATPKSGYMFSKWVKTAGAGTVTYYTGAGNGQVTDASGEEKETTYICVTGDVTLQATWEPDRSSGYVVHYGNSGKNADGGTDASQTRPWKDGKLYRATTEASDVSYFTFTAGVGDVDKVIYFKIHDVSGNKWYGNNGKITNTIENWTFSTEENDARLCIIMPGSYRFTWNKSTKKLSVEYPNDVYYLRGGFNSWDWSHPMTEVRSGVYAATINLTEANHTYEANTSAGFKVLIAGRYYGKNSTTVTRANSTGSADISDCNTSGNNFGLTTDFTGDYTFEYTVASNTLKVIYPTAYKVTYGKGTINGSTGTCSAVDLDNGSAAVVSNTTWVKDGNRVTLSGPAAKTGYTWKGWYTDEAGTTGHVEDTERAITVTITANSSYYACYTENKTAITITTDGHGTITTPDPNESPYSLGVATTQAINATASTGYHWNTWTASGTAVLVSSAGTQSNTVKGDGTNGSTGTVTATFSPNTYQVQFHRNGGAGDVVYQNFTYDVAQNLTANTYTKTGYNFAGWALAADAAVTYADEANVSNLTSTNSGTFHLYAKWTPMSCTVEFDFDESDAGFGNKTGATTDVTATYDAAMTSVTPPTAANGYAFMGYFDDEDGEGTQYYNADGTSAHAWDKATEDNVTLYAYFKKAEITLAFDDAVVLPEGTVGVTPTIAPTPVGTTIICWTILHDDDTPLTPQPALTWSEGKLTFTASQYSGTYKVQAVLRTGSSCEGGDELDTETSSFTVAGTHNVTVNYKCGDDVIKASTIMENVEPLNWTDEFTAPDVFGYTFARWDAADGVTIKNGDSDPVTTSTNATIQIKATYNGNLTAVYTQKSMIYFKNTLGWSNVYVNFYTGSYWNNPKGSGNQSVTKRNLAMTRYGETDIWYYDYGAASITPSLYVSFTSESQDNTEFFWKAGGVNVVYPANYPDAINTDKSSENGFKAATPMFVPLATQDKVTLNQSSGGKADYYNAGYWTMFTPGTGYTLEIYNNSTGDFIKSQTFTSADDLMPMKATVDLGGGQTYKFQLRRGGESSAGVYYGNSGTMTYANHGQGTPWDMTNGPLTMCRITTNASGDYTFNLSYSGNSSTPPHYRLRIAVDYPVASGDYRLVYKDDVHTNLHPSAIVSKVNDGTDIVSFFVRHDQNPEVRIQQATVNPSTGAVTWNEYPNSGTPTNQITGTIASAIESTDVYNFNLSMDGEGAMTVASAEIYEGNFYIRTDAANSKWDNYRTDPDHLMTYSEYSIEHGGYTHYYTHWVDKDETGRKNVKFTIANDYSPCISDTLAREEATGTWANIASFMESGGDLKRSANVRFMWDKRDNSISRAYIDGAQGDYSSNFLYMLNVEVGADKIKKEDDTALTDHKVTFKDNGNWMYEANIKAQPEAQIRLLSNWGTENTITQYFRGASDATETLLGGSGSTWYDIRIIYDFKTNRLIAGLIPSGTIDDQLAIHADVMFVREHQGDIAQLTFVEKDSKMGAITDIKTAFGVIQFNKWTLNNKDKSTHNPLPIPQPSRYERDLFYISFPFRVNLEEVFGFGTYGTHWIIEEYDGAARAANGFWADTETFWRFVTNRKGKFLEPNVGYLLALDLDELGESSDVWSNTDQVELYFPSYGSMPDITKSTVTYNIPEHTCNIGPRFEGGDDRRVKDSHWNVMSVPTYVNTNDVTFASTDWITTADDEHLGPNFLYTWTMSDNTLTATSGVGYTYKAMHAYMVQYCGNVTWTTSVSPALAARRNEDAPKDVEYRLELSQNDKKIDQTFVRLSNDEHVTTGFDFNYDLSKEFNRNKANIYTMVSTMIDGDLSITETAGNTLPMTEQTTVIPVGVKIAANGDYTFAIPEGTNGVGLTLIDEETGIRTQLGALDYTIYLNAGTYNERFILEISPIRPISTDLENTEYRIQNTDVRKVLIDDLLYIVRDGKMFDARGSRVK